MVAKKKTAARKVAKKKTTKKTVAKRKAPARKKATPAKSKKTSAKKAPAKKKASPKKTSSKKSAPKKTTAKKKVAKKTAAKKTAAKKTAAKKTAKRKPAAKKPAPKKTAAKKAAPRKNASVPRIAPHVKPKSLGKLVIKRKSNGNGTVTTKGTKKRVRKLTAKQLADFRQMLVVMRDQLAGQVTSLRGDSLQRHDEVNTSEDGTDAFERQFALKLASTEQDGIYEIDEALRRIDQGTFGICEISGDPIEIERLRAIPFTRHSLAAQAEIESRSGAHRQSAVRRSLV